MKRLVGSFLLLVCLVLFAANGWAGSSCAQTFKCFGTGDLCLLSMAWTAHTDGSFTATNVGATHLKALEGYMLFLMRTNPGTTAPQAAYDITLTDAHGDILGGMGANRSATATESVVPKIDGTNNLWGTAPWRTSLQLAITGNNVNSAVGVIEFWFLKE